MDNLCRICLGKGATLPIFTNEDNANSISTKLSICIQQQVLKDDGFPTKICSVCLALLDITYGFLQQYKESCRVFQTKLNNIKPSSPENSDNEKPYFDDAASCSSEPEIFLSEIKMEQDAQVNAQRCNDNFLDVDNFLHIDMEQGETKNCVYLEEKIVTKVPKKKRLKSGKKVKVKKRKKNNVHTNNIAASLLECAFQWDGERWCYSSIASPPKLDTKKSTLENRKSKYARLLDVRKALKRKRKTENKSTKPYLCHECGLVFKEVSYLKKHVKLMHMTVKTKELICTAPDCKKVFASEHNLMKHYKRVHSKDKEYVCSECGRQFAFKNELTGHMKTHNRGLYPKKDYSCKFCSQKYKTQKSVDIHERSAHTGERPSKCKVCDAAFFHDDYLKEHMRLHTGETPYKCPICGRGYAQRGNMKSHLRVHRISELDETARSTMKPNYLKLLRA